MNKYYAKFDQNGKRTTTIVNDIHFTTSAQLKPYLDDGYVAITNEEQLLYQTNQYVRNSESIPELATTSEYGKIGTTTSKLISSSTTYTPAADEVLMTASKQTENDYVKEDGTWITPAQSYIVYCNVNNHCVVDKDASYAKVEASYRNDLVNLLLAMNSAPLAVEAGTITQEQCDTNIAAMKATRLAIIAESKAKKEVIDNA